jgi:hypothetical protein
MDNKQFKLSDGFLNINTGDNYRAVIIKVLTNNLNEMNIWQFFHSIPFYQKTPKYFSRLIFVANVFFILSMFSLANFQFHLSFLMIESNSKLSIRCDLPSNFLDSLHLRSRC